MLEPAKIVTTEGITKRPFIFPKGCVGMQLTFETKKAAYAFFCDKKVPLTEAEIVLPEG
jgi:hypothetical protein